MFLSMAQEANESEKQIILVVPFNRFEFHTEFDLEQMAKSNDVMLTEVFNLYRGSLLNTMANTGCEAFEFKIVNKAHLTYLSRRVFYRNVRKPISYHASDLSRLPDEEFSKMMKDYGAAYALFINWYHVRKTILSNAGPTGVTGNFSNHSLDYDIYDLQKKKIRWKRKFKIKSEKTTTALSTMGLRISDLSDGYRSLAETVCKSLEITPEDD